MVHLCPGCQEITSGPWDSTQAQEDPTHGLCDRCAAISPDALRKKNEIDTRLALRARHYAESAKKRQRCLVLYL